MCGDAHNTCMSHTGSMRALCILLNGTCLFDQNASVSLSFIRARAFKCQKNYLGATASTPPEDPRNQELILGIHQNQMRLNFGLLTYRVPFSTVTEESAISLWRTRVDAMHVKLKREEQSLQGLKRCCTQACSFSIIFVRWCMCAPLTRTPQYVCINTIGECEQNACSCMDVEIVLEVECDPQE
jgi:hypothetical protein